MNCPLAEGRTTGCCPACPCWSPGQASYWEETFCWTGCTSSCPLLLSYVHLLQVVDLMSWGRNILAEGSCWLTPCCPEPPAPPCRSTTGRSPLFWQRRPLPATYQLSPGTVTLKKSNNLYENPRGGSWPVLGIHVIFLCFITLLNFSYLRERMTDFLFYKRKNNLVWDPFSF